MQKITIKPYRKGVMSLLAVLGLGLGACTTTTPMSSRIQLSTVATPPSGLIAFCADVRAKCHETQNKDDHDHTVSTGGQGVYTDGPATIAIGLRSAPLTEAHLTVANGKAFDKSMIHGANDGPMAKDIAAAVLPEQVSPKHTLTHNLPVVRRIEAPAEILQIVKKINQQVNDRMTWKSDQDVYGMEERWTMPLAFGLGHFGDCEDFALEKRRLLLEQGVPAGALALATTTSKATGSHALLVVRTTNGDYVLDNTNPWVLPWTETDYKWITIQEGEHLLEWRAVALREEKRSKS